MGANVRNLNWDEIDERALGGAGEVVRKVKFRHSPVFLSILFGLTLALCLANIITLRRLAGTEVARTHLQSFSADLAMVEELDSKLQLDLILREKIGIQHAEPTIRSVNRQQAAIVGQAWTNVRREALASEVPLELLKRSKSVTDAAIAALGREGRRLGSLAGILGLSVFFSFVVTIFACLNTIRKGSTTLVVQSLGRESNRASREAESHREASERAIALLQNLPIPMLEFESDGRILRWNSAMETLSGISAETALRTGVIDCIGWSNAKEMARSTIRKLFTGETVEDLQWQYRHPSGEVLELSAEFATVKDRSGSVRSAIIVLRDITAEKQNQEMLVTTDLTRTAILKALPETLLRLNANNELVEVHDNGYVLGDHLESCYKLGWQQSFESELVSSILQGVKLTRLSQRPISFEHYGLLFGREVALEFRLTASAQSETVIVVADVSDRERAALADQRSELRFRELLEGAADPLVMLNRENIVLYASNAIGDVLEVENPNITGQNWLALVDKEDRAEAEEMIRQLIDDPVQTRRFCIRLNCSCGSSKPVEVTGRNLLAKESVQAIVLNLRDVSERRRLESELKLKLRELEESNEQLRQASTRDPLTGVLNHSTALEYLEAICGFAAGGGQFSAVLIDIDEFKAFNAEHGYAEGDELLRQMAECLRITCRSEDIVGRSGSEEFLMILPELDSEQANKVIERLRRRTEDTVTHRATFSAGVVTVVDRVSDPASVIAELNTALLDARQSRAA